MQKVSNLSNNTRAYLAWFSVALFFLYQYILRVAPGVIVDELRQSFSLTAKEFGLLGSYYLYSYSLLQIPLGLIIDKVGIRKTIICSVILCMIGTLIMALSTQFWTMIISRILMGAGSATAFMGALKIAADYLPKGKRGFLMGLTLSMGTFGALIAGKPLIFCLEYSNWQKTILATLFIGIIVLIFSFMFLPKSKKPHGIIDKKTFNVSTQVKEVLKNKTIMLYAILAIGVYTPLSALADLWGTSFLRQKFLLERSDAAQISMMMYVGLAIGSILLSWFCEKYKLINRGIQLCSILLLLSFGLLLYGPNFSSIYLILLLIVIGFLCGAEMMCFTGAASFTKPENSGITIGVVNTMNMLGGAILQYVIGFGLDWQWSGKFEYNLRTYSTNEYIFSLSSLVIIISICCILSFKLKSQKTSSSSI